MEYENLKGKNNLSLASPLYAKDLDESFCVIDMRYPQDYEMIHIKDSLNLNNPYDIYEHIKRHPQKKCVLVCYSGHMASILGSELVEEGLENVYFYDDEFHTLENAPIQLIAK
ncbi:rhodanese-like domain-containing protein [Helicobacter sp. MIT 05-5293]|uniref:rhodanese-like domain-containing protein n=1 Tax=Helicobacter sp. MIT 05-5293 TaxID=1548149 RepID=UPI00051DC752|nr:rhodanese-like domain-containing protein [Helicobacter sp. MIT 05-5293]TLD81534.1 rhodanese-like domain-containing protein [Helicobacter sp. MIT 05-5293]